MKVETPAPDVESRGQRNEKGRVHFPAILGMALSLRGVFAVSAAKGDPRFWFFNQASEYGCLAQSMLSGHGYASPFCGSTGPSAFLAPGYPLLVATAFRLFGAYSPKAAAALIGMQILFGLLVVLIVMLLAKRLIGSTAANIAGVLCAISPPLVCLPILFWETSLSMLLLTGVILLALRCVEHPDKSPWLGFGAYCALAMFVNPSLLLTLAAVLIWMTWQTGTSRLRGPVLAVVAWCLIFSIWPIRNAYRIYAFIPLRTNLGYELWQGNRPGSDGAFTVALHPNKNTEEYARYAKLGEAAYMREKSELAIAAIKADKPRFLRLSAERLAKFWFRKMDLGILSPAVAGHRVHLVHERHRAGATLLAQEPRRISTCDSVRDPAGAVLSDSRRLPLQTAARSAGDSSDSLCRQRHDQPHEVTHEDKSRQQRSSPADSRTHLAAIRGGSRK